MNLCALPSLLVVVGLCLSACAVEEESASSDAAQGKLDPTTGCKRGRSLLAEIQQEVTVRRKHVSAGKVCTMDDKNLYSDEVCLAVRGDVTCDLKCLTPLEVKPFSDPNLGCELHFRASAGGERMRVYRAGDRIQYSNPVGGYVHFTCTSAGVWSPAQACN